MENRDTICGIDLASGLNLTGDLNLNCPWSSAEDEPVLPTTEQRRPFAGLVLPAMVLFGRTLARSLGYAALAITLWPRGAIDSHQWHRARARERRIFENMDDSMLKDIGLTRCDLYEDLYQRPHRRRR